MKYAVLSCLALGACATVTTGTEMGREASGDICSAIDIYNATPIAEWNALCAIAWDEFDECRPKRGLPGMDCLIEYDPASESDPAYAELVCESEATEDETVAAGAPTPVLLLAQDIAACASVTRSERFDEGDFLFTLSSGLELEVLEAYRGGIELAIYDPSQF